MNATERQQVIDIADLQVNRYFDHYLTEVFPRQMDRLFADHSRDPEAHPVQFKTLATVKSKVFRAGWMIAGMSALLGLAVAIITIVSYWTGR